MKKKQHSFSTGCLGIDPCDFLDSRDRRKKHRGIDRNTWLMKPRDPWFLKHFSRAVRVPLKSLATTCHWAWISTHEESDDNRVEQIFDPYTCVSIRIVFKIIVSYGRVPSFLRAVVKYYCVYRVSRIVSLSRSIDQTIVNLCNFLLDDYHYFIYLFCLNARYNMRQ